MPVFDTPSPELGKNPRALKTHLDGVQRDMQQLQAQIVDLTKRLAAAQKAAEPDYAKIRDELQAGGRFPLNLEQLPGRTADPQPSGFVSMTSATAPNPSRYPLSTIGHLGAVIYKVTANANGVHVWTAI